MVNLWRNFKRDSEISRERAMPPDASEEEEDEFVFRSKGKKEQSREDTLSSELPALTYRRIRQTGDFTTEELSLEAKSHTSEEALHSIKQLIKITRGL